jgi:hypothetical protein
MPDGGSGDAPVIALISAPQQVAVLGPIVAELERRGMASTVVTLDRWYRAGASAVARAAGLRVEDDAVPPPEARGFYDRPVPVIWLEVLQAKRRLEALLPQRARVVLLGNDSGLLEKLAIAIARRHGLAVALVQDGRLGRRPRPHSAGGMVVEAVKRLASPLLRGAGLTYLAASDYGEGGADVMFAAGPHGASILRHRAAASLACMAVMIGTPGQPDITRTYRTAPDPTTARDRGEGPTSSPGRRRRRGPGR